MLNRFRTYLIYGNRFCGIEHTYKKNDSSITVSVLKRSKKELNLETSCHVNSIKEVSEKLKKNQHATLAINDENVLSKRIESEQKEDSKLVYKAFPNINLDDFYFEIISEVTIHFISICRKDYVDSLISNYSEKKINIISLSLGNSLVSNLKPFLGSKPFLTSNATITLENGTMFDIKNTDVENEIYLINGLKISNQEILSFSGALHTILKNEITIKNYTDRNEDLLKDFKHIQFFNQFLKFAGLLILGVLLINFFVFNHYFNEVNALKQVSEINASTRDKIVQLYASVSKRQKMVDDLLKSNGSKTSFYVNEIIHSLPETLLISELHFQPLEKRIKEDKPIELNENVIAIAGSSNNSSLFSTWIGQLEQMKWIEKIDILDYGSPTSSIADFEIKIVLHND